MFLFFNLDHLSMVSFCVLVQQIIQLQLQQRDYKLTSSTLVLVQMTSSSSLFFPSFPLRFPVLRDLRLPLLTLPRFVFHTTPQLFLLDSDDFCELVGWFEKD